MYSLKLNFRLWRVKLQFKNHFRNIIFPSQCYSEGIEIKITVPESGKPVNNRTEGIPAETTFQILTRVLGKLTIIKNKRDSKHLPKNLLKLL